MTDTTTGETPLEPLTAVPPPQGAAGPDVEVEASVPERVLPEIEHAIGPVRQGVLDHLLDSADAGPQSVAQIIAALGGGISRNTAESAIKREFDAGRIERVAPGMYRLASPKAPEQPKPSPPEPEQVRSDGRTTEEWFVALEAWDADPSSWNVERDGPPPGTPDHRIPWDIAMRFADRLRKRDERRRDREAAMAKQAAADAELRNKLIAVTGGNVIRSAALNDVSAINAALELVPLDCVLSAIRYKTDKKLYPPNEPATSWREPRLLKAIAEQYCRTVVVPSLLDHWSKATGKKTVERAEPSSAVRVPVQQENAPVPHLPQTTPQPAMTQLRPAQANLLNTRSPTGALPDTGRPSALGLGLPSGVVGPPAPAPDDAVPPF
jgi:hypothetical protein